MSIGTSEIKSNARPAEAGLEADVERSTSSNRYLVILFILIGLIIYLGLLSNRYDANGLIEAEAIEAGGDALFSPNHILYRPIVWLLYQAMQIFGFVGRAVIPAQIVTSIAAALGLGLFFVWASRLTRSTRAAAVATLGFGTSWAYWTFSIDAYYITPAAAVVLGALICLNAVVQRRSDWKWPLVGASLLTGLAILLWQANIFLIPSVVIVLALRFRANRHDLFVSNVLHIGIVIAIVGFGYLFGSIVVFGGDWTLQRFFAWPINYGGGSLQVWGQFDASRVIPAAQSVIASFIPVSEGLGLRDFLSGEVQIDKLSQLAALPAFGLIVLFPLGAGILKRSLSSRKISLIGLLLVGYLMYMPFFVWWDPFEPKWLVVPMIAAWSVIGLLWTMPILAPRFIGIFAILVFLVAQANFTATVWPRHSLPDDQMEKARCIASYLQAEDLLISVNWEGRHLSYFFQRNAFGIIDAVARHGDKDAGLLELQGAIRAAQQNGQVYFPDFDRITDEEWIWLRSLTGVDQADLAFLQGTYSFTCGETRYLALREIA